MINQRESLSMAEAAEYTKNNENAAELTKFIKKFSVLDVKKAKDLRKKLEELNLMKLKPELISKIIDIMPETADDLNKVFTDVSADEDETKKILDTVKEYTK